MWRFFYHLSAVLVFFFLLSTLARVGSLTDAENATVDAVQKSLDSHAGSILLLKNESGNGSAILPLEQPTQADEKRDSLAIFFILLVIVLAILLVHTLIISEFHYMPESLAIVLLGALIGLILSYSRWDWREVERLNPNIFLLVLLPPIIFESGYNLHKGNFFANIVPILMFSVVGTAISAFVMGFVLYVLGWIGLIYRLTAVESFAFGSLISAVDPVITLAIFQALKVDVQLYMLAFGESMLNDAVSIVLASTAIEMSMPAVAEQMSNFEALHYATLRFLSMFFVSAAVGSAVGFISALLFKHVDLRRTPSLELALLLVFSYLPYGLAEAVSLSGIMAILFCAITMSQYTHFNVSPVTQITMQQTFRTLSFVAETCTFAYLGLALFTIKLVFYPGFLIWSIIMLFASRAANIFPLSCLINKCTKAKISMKNQIIMWFSGMRGAVAFALALYLEVKTEETKRVILTSTLVIVLFTVIFLGGTAMPMIKVLTRHFPEDNTSLLGNGSITPTTSKRRRVKKSRRRLGRKSSPVILSKTQEMVIFNNSEHFTTECEDDVEETKRGTQMPERKNILTAINENIFRPFFVRKFTTQEKMENRQKLRHIAFEALKNSRNENDANDTSSGEESFFQPTVPLTPISDTHSQPLLPV